MDYHEASAELIRAAQQTEEAFIELYQGYVQRVFRFALVRTRNRELAEDITSETFLTVVQQLHSYTPTGAPFSSWLFQIALNHIRGHFRREKSPPVDIATVADILPSIGDHRQQWLDLFLALDHLSEADREILLLKYVDDLSNQEVAKILQLSPNTATVRMHRAKERLQHYLAL